MMPLAGAAAGDRMRGNARRAGGSKYENESDKSNATDGKLHRSSRNTAEQEKRRSGVLRGIV
jgi:hypothetical protein